MLCRGAASLLVHGWRLSANDRQRARDERGLPDPKSGNQLASTRQRT